MRWSKLTLVRTLFVSSFVGAVVASCAQGSSDLGIYGAGGFIGAGGGQVTVTTGTGASTGSEVTSSGTTSSSTSTTSGFPSASSSSTSSSTSSSSSSSSGSPSSSCDTGDCSTCSDCAQNGICQFETLDCEFDCDCYNIIACIQAESCSTNACIDNCISLYPYGESTFDTLIQCLNCACVQSCQVPAGTCP